MFMTLVNFQTTSPEVPASCSHAGETLFGLRPMSAGSKRKWERRRRQDVHGDDGDDGNDEAGSGGRRRRTWWPGQGEKKSLLIHTLWSRIAFVIGVTSGPALFGVQSKQKDK